MALITRATPKEKDAREPAREWEARAKAERERGAAKRRMRRAFFASPAGQARLAFERGDEVFQYAIDVRQTQAVVVPMVNAFSVPVLSADPMEILNSVCREGWEVVNGSFVFLVKGAESRDKFLASGQQVAVEGTVIGYYLFRRAETNKRDVGNPWEDDAYLRLAADMPSIPRRAPVEFETAHEQQAAVAAPQPPPGVSFKSPARSSEKNGPERTGST